MKEPRKLPPKFARDEYAKARERLGLPKHPARVEYERKQAKKPSGDTTEEKQQ